MKWAALIRAQVLAVVAILGVRDAGAVDNDSAAFDAAKSAGTREAFESYLSSYPFGKHAADAFRSIIDLDVAAALDEVGVAGEGEGVAEVSSAQIDVY